MKECIEAKGPPFWFLGHETAVSICAPDRWDASLSQNYP